MRKYFHNLKHTKKLLGCLFVIIPLSMSAEPESFSNHFNVIQPLDILDSQPVILESRRQKTQNEDFSSIIVTNQQSIKSPFYQMDNNLWNRWVPQLDYVLLEPDSLFSSSMNFFFDRFILQFDMTAYSHNAPGRIVPSPVQLIQTGIQAGLGFGHKLGNEFRQNYPVTMLVGLKTRYTEESFLQGEEFSGSKNHLLYFTPGMGIEGRTLSFEASLELPVAKYTPQTESRLNKQVRANIEMKYRIK